jgi:hypothetical protein
MERHLEPWSAGQFTAAASSARCTAAAGKGDDGCNCSCVWSAPACWLVLPIYRALAAGRRSPAAHTAGRRGGGGDGDVAERRGVLLWPGRWRLRLAGCCATRQSRHASNKHRGSDLKSKFLPRRRSTRLFYTKNACEVLLWPGSIQPEEVATHANTMEKKGARHKARASVARAQAEAT